MLLSIRGMNFPLKKRKQANLITWVKFICTSIEDAWNLFKIAFSLLNIMRY